MTSHKECAKNMRNLSLFDNKIQWNGTRISIVIFVAINMLHNSCHSYPSQLDRSLPLRFVERFSCRSSRFRLCSVGKENNEYSRKRRHCYENSYSLALHIHPSINKIDDAVLSRYYFRVQSYICCLNATWKCKLISVISERECFNKIS